MLHIGKVLGAKPKEHVQSTLADLHTPWGERLNVDAVLQEHPDPQFARDAFCVLNGKWDCTFVASGHAPDGDLRAVVKQARIPQDGAFASSIVVPFSPEALLSGVGRQLQPDELLWYRRGFQAPARAAGDRVLLHFQAVDYACAVRVNGRLAGVHVGGYTPFQLDVTDFLAAGENELAVCVADPSEAGGQPRGKQRFDRGDIWYTAQSGIWQSVWLEIVPAAHVASIVLEPDARTGILAVGVRLCLDGGDGFADGDGVDASVAVDEDDDGGASIGGMGGRHAGGESADGSMGDRLADDAPAGASALPLRLEVLDAQGGLVAEAQDVALERTCALAARVPDVRLWSPDDPYLYTVRITFGRDVVNSYCGFRTVEVREDARGVPRVFLNGEPFFVKGVLDQAYWPDGLMTAPSDEALVFDISQMRAAGFNLMRKHIKVESARWYYHCDRLGMLVLQDMVNGGDAPIRTWEWSYRPTLFKASWTRCRDDAEKARASLGAGDVRYRREWRDTCREVVRALGNHPSIVGWSLFNEGWGQFDAADACAMVRSLDPTRPVDATSGWYDQGCGDFHSVHNYFRDMKVWRDRLAHRAFFVSEFGGFTHRVKGHSSLEEAYGYESYDDIDEWRRAVRKLLAEMNALESEGLAGYIYTQVSDIEEETNGILTYDRRVNKLDVH